ncbi:alpha/beta fold hydrolase [Mycobacterium sp.]|jgi:pimeloyl-ACP methyl ester carboxylesterase|uniref:alpha/beta fold hydrolase n=1 Tax=Mycobacterium sp. TaxID=1785 RepID=UPI002D321C8B|nr:alpha/beta fold hydrolase [Mycobacterium sp.]HZA10261.1 alpha/beta fold hydrolase [Mycobacterium sp.]
MTLNAKRLRMHAKLAALPGVRPVRRPVTPGSGRRFDLYYVRTGRKSAHPLIVIPGGPGAASVALYRGFRRRAAANGLDVIMIEHRGVGMSRHDDAGADLPPEALTIEQVVDDVAAVLDDAQVENAVIYGTSYGSYIAAGVGVRHPHRVRSMILDSPVLSHRDIESVREAIRRLLWDGEDPDTAQLAAKVRRLVDDGVLTPAAGPLAAAVYGYGGAALLNRQLDLLLRGRSLLWRLLYRMSLLLLERKAPYRNEADLVERIGFRELNYGAVTDGLPLDPAVAMREFATDAPAFEAEPFDLVAAMPNFSWPTVVISGGRDLTTPPAIAERIAALVPDAVLVRLPSAAHSALDTRERAVFAIVKAVNAGDHHRLAAQAAKLDRLPGRPVMRLLVSAIAAAAAIEGVLPVMLPRGLRTSAH